MPSNDVTLTLQDGGLGRRGASEDMICGLVTTGPTASGLANDTAYRLTTIEQLEQMGVTEAWDLSNKVLIHYHVKEFFRMNPAGTLWLWVSAQTKTFVELTDHLATTVIGRNLLIAAGGEIKKLAFARNPATGYSPVVTNGFDVDAENAIIKAQALADAELLAHRPVFIIIEGKSFTGTAAAAADLRTKACKNVSVCIAQDKTQAAKDAMYALHAGVGTMLGIVSRAKANENIGWVGKFPIADAMAGAWTNIALSGGALLSTYTDASLATINDKGYIYARKFVGLAGAWFNDFHLCNNITSDFAYGNDIITVNKMYRLLYARLLPEINSTVFIDPTNGRISASQAAYYEEIGNQTLDIMVREGELAGRSTYVDLNQNVLATSTVNIKFSGTPNGVARNITGQIGFDNPYNS